MTHTDGSPVSLNRRDDPLGLGTAGPRPVQRPAPLRQVVYDALTELIITGALQPGQHLVESELAKHLGVSRQPVREALHQLQTEGWVDLRPAQGAFVHAPTDDEVDQLLAVRGMLETEAAMLAARAATPEQVERLRELMREGERAVANAAVADTAVRQVVAANAALHAAVTAMSGNAVLAELVGLVERRMRWYYTPIARSRGRESWDEHGELIDAIAAGDAERAGAVMRRHTQRTRDAYHARSM